MAYFPDGPDGPIIGSVGDVVFYLRHGIQIARLKIIPNDPRTLPQLSRRSIFRFVSSLAGQIHSEIIIPFWFRELENNNAFNDFMSANLQSVTSPYDWPNVIISNGFISPASLVNYTYNPSSGLCHVVWDNEPVPPVPVKTAKLVALNINTLQTGVSNPVPFSTGLINYYFIPGLSIDSIRFYQVFTQPFLHYPIYYKSQYYQPVEV